MRVRVLYFARLREAIGHEGEAVDLPANVRSVGDLREWLIARGAPWSGAFGETSRLRVAVDRDMARDETPLAEGAEVAFFPPVTGG